MNIVEAMHEAWIKSAEAAIPDPPYCDFVSYEDWSRAFHLRERLAEMLLAEHQREPIHRVDAPPMPATVSDPTGAVHEAWRTFHGSPRRRLKHTTTPGPRRFPKPRVGSEDPSAIPDWMRERP